MGGEAISGAALQFNLSNGTAQLGSDSRVNGSQGLTFCPGRLCQFPQLAAITHHATLALCPFRFFLPWVLVIFHLLYPKLGQPLKGRNHAFDISHLTQRRCEKAFSSVELKPLVERVGWWWADFSEEQ